MTEHPPKHDPSATNHSQSSKAEQRERVKAHVRAVLKRLNEQLRQDL
jgi:hypothetical protein